MKTNDALRRRMSDAPLRSQSEPCPPAVSPGQRLLKTTHPNKLWPTTLGLALALALAPQARAAVVSTLSDSGAGSLRSAITNLNATGPGTITFSVTGVITLASDLPALTVPVTITGPGTNLLTLSGSNSFRLFRLAANTTNHIGGLKLANGYTANNNSGAAIYNLGYTVMTNCLLVSNTVVGGFGGAVANFGTGTLLATNCTFANNSVSGGNGNNAPLGATGGCGGGGAGMGGAVYTEGAALTISGCTFQSNVAAGGKGGDFPNTSSGNCGGGDGGFPNPGGAGSCGTVGFGGGFGGGGGGSGGNYSGGPGGFGGGGGGGPGTGVFNGQGGPGGFFGGGGGGGNFSGWGGGGGGGAGLGAGIFARTGTVSVVNCAFTSNLATNGLAGSSGGAAASNGQGVGGAIFVLDASLNLVSSTFSGNVASTAQSNLGGSTTVVNLNDSGAGSLRDAIQIVNLYGAPPTITFAPALAGQTITLTSGQITLSNTVTIDASGLPGGISVSGNISSRVFQVESGATASLTGLTIRDGVAPITGNAGGGIYNQGTLMLSNCTLTANSAANGGGLANASGGTVTITACTFSTNTAATAGGGLTSGYSGGAVTTVIESTFSGNSGGSAGGGAMNATTLNTSLTLECCTISGNQVTGSATGGGIRQAGGTFTITNCIVAGNTSVVVGAENLSGSITISGPNLTNGAPLLAPLGNYGGPTQTMPPLPGSPAIDGATNGTSFTTDQRGYPRIVGAYADLGAVESGNPVPGYSPIVTVNTDVVDGIGVGGVSLREAIAFATNNTLITFANTLSGQTILLANGELLLKQNLTIDASGLSNGIAVSGNNSSRVFEVAAGAVVNLSALNIQNGYAPNGNNPTNYGGGILNRGTLALANCTLTANQALQGSKPVGGGIANYSASATLTLQDCLVSSNHSDAYGGGGVDVNGGVAIINQCSFTANSSTSGHGGGINVEAGSATINQCTVSSNSAGSGGGVAASVTLTISNSIVAGNAATSGPNIVGSFTGAHNLTSGNPLLAALGNYGGPTLTMPPLPGSPAIDGCTGGTSFATDQRGYPRIVGTYADIGAVEGVYNSSGPGTLKNVSKLGNGSVSFTFTNYSDTSFTVLASTNVALPLSQWSNLGTAVESPLGSGQYPFTDPQATNYPQRFYRVTWP